MSYVNHGDLALFRGYIKVEIDRASDIKLRVPYISSSDISVGSTIYLPSRPNSTQLIIFTHQTTPTTTKSITAHKTRLVLIPILTQHHHNNNKTPTPARLVKLWEEW